MGLWATREQAQAALDTELASERAVLDDGFAAVDEVIGRLEASANPTAFSRIAALVTVKGRRLALGCYSLMLDGLAQEGGALMRPLIEVIDLLQYLALDPARANAVLEGRLPKAGEIAQQVEGRFKPLRDHLNDHASHFRVTFDSIRHLVDWDAGKLKPVQPPSAANLRTNAEMFFVMLFFLTVAAGDCLQVNTAHKAGELADRVEAWRRRGLQVFGHTPA
jgi:hypothetical protein